MHDNNNDKIQKNRHAKGETNHSQLTELQAISIIDRLKEHETYNHIADEMNVSRNAVYAIAMGKNWTYLTGGQRFGRYTERHVYLTEQDQRDVYYVWSVSRCSRDWLATLYNISRSRVCQIILKQKQIKEQDICQ